MIPGIRTATHPRAYLDHAATSPLTAGAARAMSEHLALVGNASSLHTSGRAARRVLEEAREELAAAVGAHPMEVVFTSGGTEADNLAVHGSWIARRTAGPGEPVGRPRVVISAIEHHALHDLVPALQRDGADVVRLPVRADGVVDPQAVRAALAGEPGRTTAVGSLMAVNNETGAIQPVEVLAEACRSAGAWSHSDAVQAFGHVPFDFAASGLDLASISAHKVGGPIGIGALLVRRRVSPAPIVHGGGQERGVRSGTLAPVLAVGFAAAAAEAAAELAGRAERWRLLRARLLAGLGRLPGVRPLLPATASPAVLTVAFDGCEADDLLLLLDAAGIDASVGSACSAGVSSTSHVLLAMGLPEAVARSCLRFSFGAGTGEEDVAALLAALPEALARARRALGGGATIDGH
ncbi:cysteine desulfurase family protein [Raineyella sp. W15-4]|uniref:cysteine desulfurase family protein n=1 Tax=Raineyella sp. W15-4 TaxID=3081651 RepID=UPI0029546C06|nr:aminotransferase class V-fold PLP-dependent enzyme [Raineyella sp. W15-4]WOQ15494.1 aminotransferase class V-fold PLP-dependent enzyme [Raineyella sp. W15-4]